ncbi:hypothetical protein BGX26_004766 [Mortierella sp. AD094]|nr:hypothetical protein BGX26_004766 [Mortierella sp. AD094]
MITPTFTVSQEEDSVSVTQNVDFEVDGAVFKFNVKPYFLRLTFPGNVVDDERATATYNVGAGELTVVLPKETPGEHFSDLDMLTKLLVRKSDLAEKQIKKPLIEIVSSGDTLEGTEKIEKDEEFDWEMPQEIRQEIFSEVRYGFNNRYSGFFTHVQETANDVLDVYDPEHATMEMRRENRIRRENDKFDDEYYMSEFMNEEEIQHLLKYKTQWWNELRNIQKAEKDASNKKDKKNHTLAAGDSIKKQERVSQLSTPASTSFTSTLLSSQSQPSTPSIFHIVKDDSEESSSASHVDSFGLKEVSSRSISSKITESNQSGNLILDLEPSIASAHETLTLEEPLIDESEPIKHLSGQMIAIVDSSKPSVDSQLEDNMADMSISGSDPAVGAKPFSPKEQELMRDLPRREYILENAKSTYLSLIDILFAYSYDLRVSEGDATVETAWTICKLSPSIAALEQFTTLKETLLASFRRALAYPLNRNWNLAMKVLQDVYVIFKLGRRGILRALLAIKEILDHDDVYYIYSKMFIEDYCVWIQSSSEKVIRTLAHELHHFHLEKSELDWHLEELEALAKEAPELEEEEEDEDETSEDEDEDSDDTSSDEDSSEEDSDSEEDDSDKGKSNEKSTRVDEEESIFIQEGPRPMIVEL